MICPAVVVTTNKTRIASSVTRVLEKISVDHFRANGGGLKKIFKKKKNKLQPPGTGSSVTGGEKKQKQCWVVGI